jgi:hypothetical protein
MIFELRSENLGGLGGPMGTEKTYANFRKFFDSFDYAKQFAEKDYQKQSKNPEAKLEWLKQETKGIRTEDLGFVMYYISPIKIEKPPASKFTDRAKGYIHLAMFKPDEIIAARTPLGSRTKKTFTINGKEYRVHMDSERYHTFAKSKKCACCGIEGNVMLLDHALNANPKEPPHFNLYAEKDGVLILMTKDHIIPSPCQSLQPSIFPRCIGEPSPRRHD